MAVILIVEDDESMRELMTAKLERKFDVVSAENGRAALSIVESKQVDLIVSDIMMPKMDGYDFVRELRNMGLSIPVIMATAKQGFDDKKDGFEVGADDYMVKPINFDELIWRIDALLRRSKIAADKEIIVGKFKLNATTYELTIQSIRTSKNHSVIIHHIKLSDMAKTLINLALLQRAILYFVGEQHASLASGIGGIVFSLVAGTVCLAMFTRYKKEAAVPIET